MKDHFATGFTLIEVIISMFLVATALIAVFGLQSQNLDLQSETRFAAVAQLLAQDVVAKIQMSPADTPGRVSGDFGEEFPAYAYQTIVERSLTSDNLYRIQVTIYRTSGNTVQDFSTETSCYREPNG